MNDNEEAKNSKGGAIGAVIGTLVLAAACAVGGWIANDMWPKKEAEKPQMPQMVTTVAVKAVEERTYNLPFFIFIYCIRKYWYYIFCIF